jgi:hypothetical protein
MWIGDRARRDRRPRSSPPPSLISVGPKGPAVYDVLFGPILYGPCFPSCLLLLLLPLAAPFMLPPYLSHARPPPSSRNECLCPEASPVALLTPSALTGWSEAPPVAIAAQPRAPDEEGDRVREADLLLREERAIALHKPSFPCGLRAWSGRSGLLVEAWRGGVGTSTIDRAWSTASQGRRMTCVPRSGAARLIAAIPGAS